MRWTAFFLFFVTIAGCTTQSSGARCQQNADCNTATDRCRSESNGRECTGGSCICCPTDPAAAAAIAACRPNTTVAVDAGGNTDLGAVAPTDRVVVTSDTCAANVDCPIGHFCYAAACEGAGRCTVRPVVSTCGAAFNPVCGCDGRTYSSPCEAAALGVRATAGACPVVATDAGAARDLGAPGDLGAPADVVSAD